ncbi:tRNA (adenosine(37)-N6)-dimethylallyltransferase MiaA [Nakamurella endophytica]|uniref:tRNA dimethylallyltransferase n=1 Tax=Nakamurella endophytica TaxID=1748367 RepID=A0A917TA30_9ACTN|nr:tRNA (adenosine(37)-N6)-dimethylallyltransferase MiaA [Nakamurella endophytica]GGM13063.1 tRNA dimethylallyltransferase [Nakamurella endophytica]
MTASRLVVVAGPTGTGKSDLALDLAEGLGGEIVNADSMQLYRGMDIGTAKTPPDERRGIPHHQLDVLDVTEPASVAAYQRHARAAVEDVLARGRTPLLVGGSGLYVQAVVDDLEFPPTDLAVRGRWERRLAEVGPAELHRLLADRDPVAAAAIEPGNGRRVVRALEVVELTGRPFSASLPRPGVPRYDAVLLLLDRDAAELDARLTARVGAMVARGLLAEVAALDRLGLRRGVTASRALGYQQLLPVLDGRRTLTDAAADTVAATRRFARRQRSWFRRDRRWLRLDAAAPDLAATARAAVRAAPAAASGR